jgi:hypothetical protein
MDTDVISGRETMAAPEVGDGGGGRGKEAGGRKHLSSIANHVLQKCSRCVRLLLLLLDYLDPVVN